MIFKVPGHFESINLYFEDETRFGLFTKNGRTLTAKGVKPICPFHQIFKSTYLFGAFSPINGDKFLLELPFCNSIGFQTFLNEFSLQNPAELKVVVLDNGAFHKAAKLVIPANIALVFLPPYSPELNPAEKIWARMKRDFTNRLFHSLDQLSCFIDQAIAKLSNNIVMVTCSFSYIFNRIIWSI